MTVPTITALPTAPARTDSPSVFNTRADAFLGALYSPFATEMNASIGAFNTDFTTVNSNVTAAAASATAAATSATEAASSATAAATTANAAMWVSGQAYSSGDNAISGVDYKTYRATTSTSGTTDPSSSGDWTALAYELPNQSGNSGKFLTTNGSAESWGEVAGAPSLTATASGTLANGDTVIVNADGTVSAVSGAGASADMGADQIFCTGSTTVIQSCYDTSNDRLVIVYKDASTARITVSVGEISGDTITFGTVSTLGNMHANWPDIAYNPNVDRVCVVWRKASPSTDYLAGAVGEVDPSTNTITFGFVYGLVSDTVRYPAIVYASGMGNEMVVGYHIEGGTYDGKAFIGTITGGGTNEIAANTAVTINSGRTWHLTRGLFYDPDTNRAVACFVDYDDSENVNGIVIENTTGTTLDVGSEIEIQGGDGEYVAACYDTTNDKGICFFRDKHDGNYLKAVVLTITGGGTNSFTIGTEVAVDSTGTINHIDCHFDPTAGKVVVIYELSGGDGYINTGTISGTGASATSTWDGRTAINSGSSGIEYNSIQYDEDTNRSVLMYVDKSNSNKGTANMYTVPYGSTNVTTENYIGISDGAYGDGVAATIQLVGSVDDAQTSLTAGQSYYIDFDGSLVLTPPADPEVFAGTAVSATQIIVKG